MNLKDLEFVVRIECGNCNYTISKVIKNLEIGKAQKTIEPCRKCGYRQAVEVEARLK